MALGQRHTQQGIIAGIRERLGRPPYDTLSNDTIYEFLQDEIENLNTRAKLANQNWIIANTIVTVHQDNYNRVPINPGDFGRADTVETFDNGAPDFRRRELDIIDYQDIDQHWSGRKPIAGDSIYPHNSRKVAFYRDDTGQWFAIFVPPPFISTQYKIWYQPGFTLPRALTEKPGFRMELFYNLLKINTAIACLPHMAMGLKKHGFWDPDLFAALQGTLMDRKAEFDTSFERWIAQNNEEQSGMVTPFNASRRGYFDDEEFYY